MATRCGVRIAAVTILWAVVFLLGAPSAGAQGLCEESNCVDSKSPFNDSIYRVCAPEMIAYKVAAQGP